MRILIAIASLCLASGSLSQCAAAQTENTEPSVVLPAVETLPNGLGRLSGTDTDSGITYTRLFLTTKPATPVDLSQPTLTAECSHGPKSKPRLEIFINFGNVPDATFYPPWHATQEEPTQLPTAKDTFTFNFLGYTKFKPAKRVFEEVRHPLGQFRDLPPGLGSRNLEEFTYFLQVLRALPTLRVTNGTLSADFLTTPLLTQLHNEPACAGLGL